MHRPDWLWAGLALSQVDFLLDWVFTGLLFLLCHVDILPGLLFARLALGLGWVGLGPDWHFCRVAFCRITENTAFLFSSYAFYCALMLLCCDNVISYKQYNKSKP